MEPSLLPSAERVGIDFGLVMAEWLALLDFFLLSSCPPEEHAALESFARTYKRLHFGMAMAQHYGLPSTGLDVTASLDVALFFALNDFVFDEEAGGYVAQHVDAEATPVLYVFMAPERFAFAHEELFIADLVRAPRPQRQAAHFMHTGWGLAKNQNARYLLAASIWTWKWISDQCRNSRPFFLTLIHSRSFSQVLERSVRPTHWPRFSQWRAR